MSAVPGEGEVAVDTGPTEAYRVVKTWTSLRPSTNDLAATGNHVIPDLTLNVPVLDWTKYFVKGKVRATGRHYLANSIVALRLYGEAVPGSGTLVTYSDETSDTSPSGTAKIHSVAEPEAYHFFTSNGTGIASIQMWAHTLTSSYKWVGALSYTVELCWAENGVPGQPGSQMVRNTTTFNGA